MKSRHVLELAAPREADLYRRSSRLHAQEAELYRRSSQLYAQEAELHRRSSELYAREARLRKQWGCAAGPKEEQLLEQVEALTASIEVNEAEIQRLTHHIQTMENTLSWRMTSPVRAFRNMPAVLYVIAILRKILTQAPGFILKQHLLKVRGRHAGFVRLLPK